MSKCNKLQFQLELIDHIWSEKLKSTDDIANELVQTLTEKLNVHAPLTETNIACKWGNKHWWTAAIKEEINIRDNWYKRAVITNLVEHWNLYRRQRNKVVAMMRQQKQNYYYEKIDQVKGDSNKMWKTLKNLFHNNGKTQSSVILFNGKIETDKTKIAENFNDYYIKSINIIAQNIDLLQTQEILQNITPLNTFNRFETLQLADLRKIVNNLKNKNNSVDGISTKIIKLAFEVIGHRFLQLINSSLETGSFPQNWKNSTIIPIEKVSNTVKCEEYRPINIVPIYEKLLETVVNNQMRKFVEENNLLTQYQAGFRKKHSCESALQSVISRWKVAISEKKFVGIVFLDFKRAFETVNRGLLMQKLEKYGFKGTVYKWFSEYLNSRTQQTKFHGVTSSVKINIHGVPQGTVMGPDLFVLYINDMVKVIEKCKIQLFADDTILFSENCDINDLILTINKDLDKIYKWLCHNSLSVNVKKTKLMILKPKQTVLDTYNHNGIIIANEQVEQVNEYKYLGVVIDETLSFSSHANYITKKVARKINLLCRLGKNLSSWTRLLIYKTIVLPHFNFCSTILYMFSKQNLDILQKKQNQALRCILGCNRYTRIKDMLGATRLLSVRQNIILNTMIVIFKIKNGMYPEHILENLRLIEDIHTYNTRNRTDFYVTTVTSSFAQNSLFHKGLIEFNSLPQHIKSKKKVINFKNSLKKYIVEMYTI